MTTLNITGLTQNRQILPQDTVLDFVCLKRDEPWTDTTRIETVKLEIGKRFQLKGNAVYTGVESRQDAQGNSDEEQFLDEGMDGR